MKYTDMHNMGSRFKSVFFKDKCTKLDKQSICSSSVCCLVCSILVTATPCLLSLTALLPTHVFIESIMLYMVADELGGKLYNVFTKMRSLIAHVVYRKYTGRMFRIIFTKFFPRKT